MAVTATKNVALSGPGVEVWDVKADQDADVTAALNHSLGVIPRVVKYHLSAVVPTVWFEDTTKRTAVQVQLKKDTGVGSGATGNQVRVYLEGPHSIAR